MDRLGGNVTILGQVLSVVFILLLGFTVVLIALSFPAGLYALFGAGSDANPLVSQVRPFLLVGPTAVGLPILVNVGAFFVFLSLVYMAMFVYLLTRQKSPTSAILTSLHEGVGALLRSPFILAIVCIAFLIFTSTVIDRLAPASGPPVTFLGLTFAPLVEELGFRVFLIGVFAGLLSLRLGWKGVLAALWRPSSAYSGGNGGILVRGVVIALLLISSFIFGAAHVMGGWSLNKMYGGTYGGLILGYLYVRYGFVFAVVAHWGVDYFGSAFAFFGQTAYGIPVDGPGEFFLQRAVDYDMFQFLGLASFLLVVYLGLKRLQRRSACSEVHKDAVEESMFGI